MLLAVGPVGLWALHLGLLATVLRIRRLTRHSLQGCPEAVCMQVYRMWGISCAKMRPELGTLGVRFAGLGGGEEHSGLCDQARRWPHSQAMPKSYTCTFGRRGRG